MRGFKEIGENNTSGRKPREYRVFRNRRLVSKAGNKLREPIQKASCWTAAT